MQVLINTPTLTLLILSCDCSMENQLIDFERQHGIVMRWKTIDKQYIDARNNFLLEKKRRIEASLWSSVIKRHYLLKMKAKYAGEPYNTLLSFPLSPIIIMPYIDGQKIAKKLSSSIRKEMKRIGAIVEEYNATVQDKITVAEVLPPDSSFWKQSPITTTDEGIPWALKRSTAQALLVMKRSKEEIELLRQEMRNVINYWKHRQRCITDFISEQSDTSRFDRGARSLLLKSMWESEVMLEKSTVTFAPVFAHSDIDHEFVQESENSDLHFESDSDSGQSSESDGE